MRKIPKLTKQRAYNLHRRLCKELGIPSLSERKFKIKNYHFEDAAFGTYFHDDNTIHIYKMMFLQAQGRNRDWRRTVAHETYHHYQSVKGWVYSKPSSFKVGTRTVVCKDWYWKGRRRLEYWDVPYSRLPWEAGAIRYENKIAAREGWLA